jgi:hypothetical protein
MDLLRSLRALVFGETWSVPAGVAAALITAILVRAAVPHSVWSHLGGFLLAALVATTLAHSLRPGR